MLKTLLAATMALVLMSGAGFAQSSYSSSSTETTTQVAPPTHDVDVTETTRRTSDRNGVMIEHDERGTEDSAPADVSTTRSETESTTVR
jgi:hypothetical protein